MRTAIASLGLLVLAACDEPSVATTQETPKPTPVASTASPQAAQSSVNPDTALLQIFGRPMIWCPTERAAIQVAAQFTEVSINGGKVTTEAVKNVVRGCGTTTNLGMVVRNANGPILTGRVATSDGSFVPTYRGPGGRVLF